jgi:CxxC-x17-CxxC domain-containing protein
MVGYGNFRGSGSGSSRGGFGGRREGGFRRGGFGGRRSFGPREMTKIKCAECGKEDEVPFKPRDNSTVLCKECYFKKKGIEPGSKPESSETEGSSEKAEGASEKPEGAAEPAEHAEGGDTASEELAEEEI